MSLKIFISVILGTLVGYLFLPETISSSIGIVIDLGLMLLLFCRNGYRKAKDVFSKVKRMGVKILLVPFAVIVGSVVGGILAGIVLRMPLNEAGAVAGGLGWYTLSSTILLAEGYVELSALAFLANVFREIIALISIPLIAKYIGNLEAVSTGGATTMDTSLPVISASTNPQTAIIAFVTGVICTSSVPIIVPLLLKLNF